MTTKILLKSTISSLMLCLLLQVSSFAATFTTIDAPGAGTGVEQGTIASSINNVGAITGNYADASNISHGFLRAPDGTFTTFDVLSVNGGLQSTVPFAINDVGAITGEYIDAGNTRHGFLRAPGGTITPFDAPGAGNGGQQGIHAQRLDARGGPAQARIAQKTREQCVHPGDAGLNKIQSLGNLFVQ